MKGRGFWLVLLALSAGAGVLYNAFFVPARPEVGALRGALIGSIYGLCTGVAVLGFERGLILPRILQAIRLLPGLLYIIAAEAAYVAMITLGNFAGGAITWGTGLVPGLFIEAVSLPRHVLLYSLIVSAALVFIIRIRDLIGGEVFVNLLIGRYHRPVREDRIFLFVDLVGSTAYAERHGDLRAQAYLAAVFAAMAEPVRRHRGAIDDYIGDMAMITWPHARGAHEARCVACLLAIEAAIARDAAEWERRFEDVPRFRAALHGGAVVTAEVGVDRHKIAYFGDVVNMTARLESLCREVGAPFLVSIDLLARLPLLPPGIVATPLGDQSVKGRDAVFAVARLDRSRPPP